MDRALDVYERRQNYKRNVFNTKLDGIRRVGTPKMRWKDGVDQDMRILKVKNWKKVTLDRDEWAKLLKKVGPTKGCRANGDDDDESRITNLSTRLIRSC
jgi:hypothetical protein